jgi:hypothetical protein
MQRPFEAFTALLVLHPMASASCVIVTTVTTTTPNNASAATKAIAGFHQLILNYVRKRLTKTTISLCFLKPQRHRLHCNAADGEDDLLLRHVLCRVL